MHRGIRDHDTVDMASTIGTNVSFHAKVQLVAFPGSLAMSLFLVELGTPMMLASTIVPSLIIRPLSDR